MTFRELPLAAAPPDLGVAAWSALLRTHAAVVRVIEQQVEAATGLPLSWYDVLLELHGADGGQLRMQELSGRVVLSRTRVSRLVDDLVDAGLVQRIPDPADGRAKLARITDEGTQALRRTAPTYLAAIGEHFSRHLSDDQLDAIHAGLHQVLDAHHR